MDYAQYPKRPLTPDTSSSRTSRSVRFKPDVEERVYQPEKRIHRGIQVIRDIEEEEEEEEEDETEDDGVREGRHEGGEQGEGNNGGRGRKRRERVLCLHGPNGANLSAAYYDPSTKTLDIMEDTKDTVDWDLAVLIMEQLSPDRIIMSSKTQDGLVDKIDEYCLQHNINAEIRPSRKSDRADAINQLSNLRLTGLGDQSLVSFSPGDTSSSDTATELEIDDPLAKYGRDDLQYAGMGRVRLGMVKLGAWVNVDAPLAVIATGVLLTYLRQIITQETLPGEEIVVEAERIESMQLDQHMFINQDALTSLSIFEHEKRPQDRTGEQQDVISLYRMLKTTVTPLGHKLLRMWLLRPLVDVDRIKARQDAVKAFVCSNNQAVAEDMTKILRKVKNMPLHIKRISKGQGGVKEWRALVDALLAAISVRELVISIPEAKRLEIGVKVYHMLSDNVLDFYRHAIELLDFDTSNIEKRLCVRPGVDQVLDEVRRDYDGLSDVLDMVARKIRQSIDPRHPIDLNVVYFGQIGFLASVEPLGDGFEAPKDWEVRFSSESIWYFKTKQIRKLDEEFGDIETVIAGREIELVQELVERLQGFEHEISGAMNVLAELDCLLALARAAENHHMACPQIVEEPILEIHGGRNLLQERYVQTYIANDTMMAGGTESDVHSMMIVTGANGSGKSAYGRQVALIVFLAQIGSFVPAESAVIGVVDKIFTRMQTRESASKDASAFMIDLSQVSLALRGATTRSLIVLDEFGKGTTPADGAGLLAGVIEYLLNGPCPRTIVLTHFHELFTEQFVNDELPIMHCHMKTELMEGSKELVYLYRLTPGKSLSSNAADCALAHGIPRKVVERAREVSQHIARFEISKIYEAALTSEDIQELEQAEDLARRFLDWNIDEKNEDVMEVLQNMLDNALGVVGEDGESGEPRIQVETVKVENEEVDDVVVVPRPRAWEPREVIEVE